MPSRRVQALQSHLTAAASASHAPTTHNPHLVGNFRPTQTEGFLGAIKVLDGQIPGWLHGQFLRVGPNPKFDFDNKPYHAFDGDGFVHAVTFSDGSAKFTKRFVRTRRLVASEARGFDVAEMGMMAEGDFSYAGTFFCSPLHLY